MAFRISRLFGITVNLGASHHSVTNVNTINLLRNVTVQVSQSRNITFFNRKPSSLLWKSATSVSNAGKKRGRGRNLGRKTNIYNMIGHQEVPIQFPGFTSPVRRGNMFTSQRVMGQTDKVQRRVTSHKLDNQKRFEMEDKIDETGIIQPVPLRGWSSRTIKGKKLGPPDPTENESFEGFESWILDTKIRTTMHPTLGRVKKYYSLCVTGNGNGTAGFASVVGKTNVNLASRAKTAAGQRLLTIGRYEDRTVLHDFHACFGRSKIIVRQAPAGYGLICHRALQICCQAFGIKDIYAKSEGSRNITYLLHAFFVGLLKQKTFQEMADEKKLHLVQLRGENYFYPKVLASPSVVRKREEILPNENLDFNQYIMDGKLLYMKKKPEPFYTRLESYKRYLRKAERRRGQEDVRIRLNAQYGAVKSFLASKYPEAQETRWKKKRETEES